MHADSGQACESDADVDSEAEAEAIRLKDMLKNATGDEAVQLLEQLQAVKKEQLATKKKMGEKIMSFVGKRWKYAIVIRGMTVWKVQMASGAVEDKATHAAVGQVFDNSAVQVQVDTLVYSKST